MAEHDDCIEVLSKSFAEAVVTAGLIERDGARVELSITTVAPLVLGPYTKGMTCPHGVTFWLEPTSEQIAEWVDPEAAPIEDEEATT